MTRSIILAHQIEVMARQKELKPLRDYLEPPSEAEQRNKGAAAWLSALRAMKAKQDGKKGGAGADQQD